MLTVEAAISQHQGQKTEDKIANNVLKGLFAGVMTMQVTNDRIIGKWELINMKLFVSH